MRFNDVEYSTLIKRPQFSLTFFSWCSRVFASSITFLQPLFSLPLFHKWLLTVFNLLQFPLRHPHIAFLLGSSPMLFLSLVEGQQPRHTPILGLHQVFLQGRFLSPRFLLLYGEFFVAGKHGVIQCNKHFGVRERINNGFFTTQQAHIINLRHISLTHKCMDLPRISRIRIYDNG